MPITSPTGQVGILNTKQSKTFMIITLKKMPGEPGEMEAMRGAILGWVSQGLQHEVIAMASCCKKGGGQ